MVLEKSDADNSWFAKSSATVRLSSIVSSVKFSSIVGYIYSLSKPAFSKSTCNINTFFIPQPIT